MDVNNIIAHRNEAYYEDRCTCCQGAFIEHEHMIEEIGHTAIEIRQRDDLED